MPFDPPCQRASYGYGYSLLTAFQRELQHDARKTICCCFHILRWGLLVVAVTLQGEPPTIGGRKWYGVRVGSLWAS
jgi:hypothetical protein